MGVDDGCGWPQSARVADGRWRWGCQVAAQKSKLAAERQKAKSASLCVRAAATPAPELPSCPPLLPLASLGLKGSLLAAIAPWICQPAL